MGWNKGESMQETMERRQEMEIRRAEERSRRKIERRERQKLFSRTAAERWKERGPALGDMMPVILLDGREIEAKVEVGQSPEDPSVSRIVLKEVG